MCLVSFVLMPLLFVSVLVVIPPLPRSSPPMVSAACAQVLPDHGWNPVWRAPGTRCILWALLLMAGMLLYRKGGGRRGNHLLLGACFGQGGNVSAPGARWASFLTRALPVDCCR